MQKNWCSCDEHHYLRLVSHHWYLKLTTLPSFLFHWLHTFTMLIPFTTHLIVTNNEVTDQKATKFIVVSLIPITMEVKLVYFCLGDTKPSMKLVNGFLWRLWSTCKPIFQFLGSKSGKWAPPLCSNWRRGIVLYLLTVQLASINFKVWVYNRIYLLTILIMLEMFRIYP